MFDVVAFEMQVSRKIKSYKLPKQYYNLLKLSDARCLDVECIPIEISNLEAPLAGRDIELDETKAISETSNYELLLFSFITMWKHKLETDLSVFNCIGLPADV